MAIRLGPGGRWLLVLLGVVVIGVAIERAGWWPAARVAAAPPAVEAPQPLVPRAASCEAPLLVAAPPRLAVLRAGGAELRPAPTGAAALERLARGEVEGALASVAEVAAAWPIGNARLAAVLGGGRDLLVVAAAPHDPAALAGAVVAAPARSAEAFLAGAVGGAKLTEVADAGAALGLLGSGRAQLAAIPAWQAGPAGPVGRPVPLQVGAPLDPVVLVAGERAGCFVPGEVGDAARVALEQRFGPLPADARDAPPRVGELAIAWAAARQRRPALPPLELAVTAELADAIWGGAPRDLEGGQR